MTDTKGYRAPIALLAAGITYRQLDYWARTGLVQPTIVVAAGSGSQRLYSAQDVALLKVVKRLIDLGLSFNAIRALVDVRDVNAQLAGTEDDQ